MVRREFLFDSETAVTAYHKIKNGSFGFLLESFLGGEQWARYSFLGSRPRAVWLLEGKEARVWSAKRGWRAVKDRDPLSDLERRLGPPVSGARGAASEPRFTGGVVGYFGYDFVRGLERLGPGPREDKRFPTATLLFTDVVIAVDNLSGRAMALTDVLVPKKKPGEAALKALYRDAMDRIDDTVQRLWTRPGPEPLSLRFDAGDAPFQSNAGREEFLRSVERIKEYIRAGDVFQVVLSQRLSTPFDGPAFNLYRAIRTLNPSPYMFHLDLEDFAVVGASPEVLARLEDGVVTVRPIAGTRRRGETEEEDQELARELRADEKELAEHRMLVDLGRNDVGRVSEYGSVTVPELMRVERYSHVMHLCSRVEGRARSDLSALEVLAACFPAGTVSGAPKIRAMEIIDSLEPTARGPYAGAVGHISWGCGTMDTAIAIRTMLVRGGEVLVQAGAGVVADSKPEAEYEETLSKARALLRAVRMAAKGEE